MDTDSSNSNQFAYRTSLYQKLKQLNCDILTFQQNSRAIDPKLKSVKETQYKLRSTATRKGDDNPTLAAESMTKVSKGYSKCAFLDKPKLNFT